MMHYFIGDLGHFFVILSFVSALIASFSYYKATLNQSHHGSSWLKNANVAFYIHAISVVGVVVSLFIIIYNHYFEYHYAYSHSSRRLPTHYMISCFWEGQEGSFLLWMFWHALIGIVLIFTNRFWRPSIMAILSAVQVFLASMILGVVVPWLNLKIGSDPFILLRDAINAPIFQTQPEFIPEDGTGLNPLLQNYWMVIHPPTLFLGFALSVVPFLYVIAGLWLNKFTEWVRPALPWALFSAAVLGLGILMGGYWAYETLNFGGYWNWDPVENAVYVPWLILVAGIHTMITYKNSGTALKSSIILVITAFLLILYSTFLTRSGVLGESSVHSFTDLGLSGQLLLYLTFFVAISLALAIWKWKKLPSSKKEAATYSREFWVFIGALTLCMMGLQVIWATSIPVFNKIIEFFGGFSSMAPPTDQIGFYTKFQLWFAVLIALFTGTVQFLWWKKISPQELLNQLIGPFLITLLVSTVFILFRPYDWTIAYIVLLVASIYTIVGNSKILISLIRKSPKLSGGAVTHIGIGLMLIGILYSSGYSKVVSLNNTGMLISREADDEFNNENLLLFLNEPKQMAGYELTYKGERFELRDYSGYVNKNDLLNTAIPYQKVLTDSLDLSGKQFAPGDTLEILPENTYYEIQYVDTKSDTFSLYPRAQVNEAMGLLASPDIYRTVSKDLYTHVSSIRDPQDEDEWSELEEFSVAPEEKFFVNDYVTYTNGVTRVTSVPGMSIDEEDVAIKGQIVVLGEDDEYIAEPYFIIRNGLVARIPDEIPELGIRLSLMNIVPQENKLSIGANTRQKDWVVLKAMEKPLINVLWIGTLVVMAGFSIAIFRRYSEFRKMREKGLE